MRVQPHRYHSITQTCVDQAFATLQWAHLPRHQIIGGNNRPGWVCRPSCGWVEISSGENIFLDARYRYSYLLVEILLEWSAAEEILKIMEDYSKRSQYGLQWGTVEYNIRKH